ncbi:MAG: S41 family peptidase [Candidatus Omnitrophica bacterium]|nr:S41 family peptidase [Candidatus Omnitrophota bacterium]
MKRQAWLIRVLLAGALVWTQAASLWAVQTTAPTAATPAKSDSNEEIYKELDLFENALSIVRSDYVEEPQAKQLIYGALKGMLATLDPYSQFLDPDSYNELKIDTGGEFGGLGIEITIKDDLLTVISPIDDTPAYDAGILAGDRIVKIDGELTRGITLMDAVKKLRGKPNTDVKLTILHNGETELKELTLKRAIIKIRSIREASILDDHIGYIRLSDFREHSTEDMEAAINRLKGEQMDSLVLDLRNNPGGLLDVAVSIGELFLDRQQVIVSTKGRLRNQNQEMRSTRDGSLDNIPLVVLVNEGSASASEILAGAIQDHHRGVILGIKSHGKGSVQTIFPLKDGSALRLTTSKWFTPDGRPIHGKGITPDVEVPLERRKEEKTREQKAQELFDRIEAGEKLPETPADTSEKEDKAKSETPSESKETPPPAAKGKESAADRIRTDSQLARAVDLLKGLKVYQGKEKAHALN